MAFTVVWVDASLKYYGNASSDNSALAYYKANTRADGSDSLGVGRYKNGAVDLSWGVGFEVKGAVSPADFSYVGLSFGVSQNVDARTYHGQTLVNNNPPELPNAFSDNIRGNERILPSFLDNAPGSLYFLDYPGFADRQFGGGDVRRLRMNIKDLWYIWERRQFGYTDYVVSNVVQSHVRLSTIQLDNAQTSTYYVCGAAFPAYIFGDNEAPPGFTSLAWNLQ